MAFTYDDPDSLNGQSNQAFFNQMTAQATGQPPPAPKQESGSGVGTAIGVGALLTGAGAIALAMKKGKFSNLKPLTKSNDDVAESTIAKSHEAVKEKYIPKDDVVPSAPVVRETPPIKREEVRVGPIDDMMKPRSTTYNTGILDKIFTDGGRLEMRDFRDMPDDKIFDLYGKWDSAAAAMAKNDPASDKAKSWTHNFENLQNELSTRGYTFSKVKEGDELDGIRMQSFGTQHSDTIDVDGVTEVFGSGQVVYKPNGQVALPVNVRTSDGPAPHVIDAGDGYSVKINNIKYGADEFSDAGVGQNYELFKGDQKIGWAELEHQMGRSNTKGVKENITTWKKTEIDPDYRGQGNAQRLYKTIGGHMNEHYPDQKIIRNFLNPEAEAVARKTKHHFPEGSWDEKRTIRSYEESKFNEYS